MLKEAAADLRFLLNRGYPRAAGLTLVGNRYNLDRIGRQVLQRGVFASEQAGRRRAKLTGLGDLLGQDLGVDGHNVLITLECACRGLPLVAADDGFIRDVAEISRAYRASADTDWVLNLVGRYLSRFPIGAVTIFFDAPMSRSGELAQHTQEIWAAAGVAVTARAVPVPERQLLVFPGPVATSDTHLIDACPVLLDLAGEIIRRQWTDYPHLIVLG